MPRSHILSVTTVLLSGFWTLSVHGQTLTTPAAEPEQVTQEVFTAENAILDTSIPFAIGAREAQQELRSAFGWPTFQEGLVQGVYFRLDPDGYARFSPTPRLESDVFEVICQPGTATACMGRKDQLSVYLSRTGLIEIKISDVAPGDTFFISDGLVETPVPERILMPLDPPLEAILAYGSELIVRRGPDETVRISLKGFGPVAAYLRWIAARQDYAVLPRDWPIPGSAPVTGQADIATLYPGAVDPVAGAAASFPVNTAAPVSAALPMAMPDPTASFMVSDAEYRDLLARLQRLEGLVHVMAATQSAPTGLTPTTALPAVAPAEAAPAAMAQADQLDFLVSQLGFDTETASLILMMQGSAPAAKTASSGAGTTAFSETQSDFAAPMPTPGTPDFVPLSEYLKTVTPQVP